MKTVIYTEIKSNELDSLVKKIAPQLEFEFVAWFEANNDSAYTFQVTKNDIEYFKQYGGIDLNHATVSDILTFLVVEGYIPEGNILITVSW